MDKAITVFVSIIIPVVYIVCIPWQVEHPNSPNLAALNDSSQDSSIADEFFCSECSFTTSLRIKLKRHEEVSNLLVLLLVVVDIMHTNLF